MSTMITRTAPRGARFMQASAPLSLKLRDGRNLLFSTAEDLASGVRQLAAGLSDRSPKPGNDAPDAGARMPAPPTAAAVAPVCTMINGAAIYARMNTRPTSPKAPVSAAAAPAPAMLQTNTGPILNARAIHERHNAAAALRAGRTR